MKNLPSKPIFLLVLGISTIIAMSVYSTYAVFTFESETSDIVNISTPDKLTIFSDKYEYKQVTVPANESITTDVDIYNNLSYDLCYSVWYKIVNNKNVDTSKVKVYQNTEESITTSSEISSIANRRISIVITNDNNIPVKVNIGLNYAKNDKTCELKIGKDKSLITSTISNPKKLSTELISINNQKEEDTNYLIYKDNTKSIQLTNDLILYVANDYNYQDELFTLNKYEIISLDDLKKYQSTINDNYYLCIDSNSCKEMYRIVEVDPTSNNSQTVFLSKYDTYVGYMAGKSGLRKVANNYYYYGDNPDNFIYYNCQNERDTKTCELWRIIGIFNDPENNTYLTKIIRNDYLTNSIFDKEHNIWNDSSLSKYLNDEYKINNPIGMYNLTVKEENIINLETDINKISYLKDDIKSSVLLMNLTDFVNASICEHKIIANYDSTCLKNNWLNKNNSEWTMTTNNQPSYIDSETNENITPENNTIYSVGNEIINTRIDTELSIRPVVYLSSRTFLVDGNGTLDSPYIIK